jgi:hypothetical protein
MKNLSIIVMLVVSTSVFAQEKDFCVSISLKENVKTLSFQKVKYSPAGKQQMQEEHTKADYFLFASNVVTFGNCGEESCCFDSFQILKTTVSKNKTVFDAERYEIVFDKKAKIISVFIKSEELYYQYTVLGECNFND